MKEKSKSDMGNDDLLEKKIKETRDTLKNNYKDLREDADEIVEDIKKSTPESLYFITGLMMWPLGLISKDFIKSKTKLKRFNQGALVGASFTTLIIIINIISIVANGFVIR